MEDNKRSHFRVKVTEDIDVHITVGLTGQVKHKVVDVSEGGIAFRLTQEEKPKTNMTVSLHFPDMREPVDVNIRITRSSKAEDTDTASSDIRANPAKWGVGARFVALNMGQEDKLFHEVRKLDRLSYLNN